MNEETKPDNDICANGYMHDYEIIDDSFSYEFGTNNDYYYKCSVCGNEKEIDDWPVGD